MQTEKTANIYTKERDCFKPLSKLYALLLYSLHKNTVAFRLKEIMHNNSSPILAKTAGVATVLRFPSSARFDEFPVLGKSFPFRKTINCSLQVELSTDCQAED